MIVWQTRDALVFWPEHQVAALTPEFEGRWRGVMADGSVAHRPGPPSPEQLGAWVPLGTSLVRPELLTRTPDGWTDPAGFTHPGQTDPLPAAPPPAPLPEVDGLPCRRASVWAVEILNRDDSLWRTDEGEFIWKHVRPLVAVKDLPEMFTLRRGYWLNRLRLRRIYSDGQKFFLTLDNGVVYDVMRRPTGANLPARLGLPQLDQLEPARPELYHPYALRDWPFELLRAPGAQLQRLFTDSDTLMAHLIWQRHRQRQAGLEKEWSDGYRGFWYDIAPVLYRCGFLQRETPPEHWDEPDMLDSTDATMLPDPDDPIRLERHRIPESASGPQTSTALWKRLFAVMGFFVKDARLFRFLAFGFVDPHPELRHLGDRLPHVVLVAEKDAFHHAALQLGREFGVTVYLLGGQPSLLRTEWLAHALRPLLAQPAHVIAYTDYDAGGWVVGQSVADQLALFEIPTAPIALSMITEDSFTAEEKRLYAHPCSMDGPERAALVQNWLKHGGGLNGQPFGIHADHIRPFARVRDLFLAALQKVVGE